MKNVPRTTLLKLLLALAFSGSLPFAQAQSEQSPPGIRAGLAQSSGITVSMPNGFASIAQTDMSLSSAGGPVDWMRYWDGREWKFNPNWESLSLSWGNLTSGRAPESDTLIEGSFRGGGGSDGVFCSVWVDEDWQPSGERVLISGGGAAGAAGAAFEFVAEPIPPIRGTPFNRLMGAGSTRSAYSEGVSVNADWLALCPPVPGSSASMYREGQDLEGIRRINELYLGEGGRYAFSNRAVLERRAVKEMPAAALGQLTSGQVNAVPQDNPKGYRWIDRGGDWIDYNTQGQVVAYVRRNNIPTWLVRDDNGAVRGVVDANGRVLYTLHYTGELITEVRDYPVSGLAGDLPARSVKYSYDAGNRLSEVTDVRGNITRYGYDSAGRVVRITDPEARVETLAYRNGVVSQHTAADGGVTDYAFSYDEVNKQYNSKITGPLTQAGRRVEQQTHNRVGKLVTQVVNGRTEVEVKYDSGARIEMATNARGFATKTTTNEFEQIVAVAQPDGASITRSFSALHLRMTERVDELGFKTQYEYDARGNLLKVTEAAGTAQQRVTEYTRNNLGQLIALVRKGRTEANGSVTPDATWQASYDAQGEISQIIDPEGNTRSYRYDRGGNLLAYTDPLGRLFQYEVDAQGNLTKETNALGYSYSYSYDKVGNLIGETDARGKATLMAYDAMNRFLQSTDPAGGVAKVQYNAQGLPIQETDEDGRASRIEYDNFQRLLKQIDGKNNTTTHAYNLADGSSEGAQGSLFQPTETRYPTFTEQNRFDARERLTSQTVLNPTALGTEGLITTRKYDKRGRVIETTNPEGKTSTFAYDAFGRTTRFTNSLGESLELTWDVRNNLIQVKDAKGNTTRFEYDRINRLLKEILPLGQTTTYSYDAKGNRTGVVDPLGHRIQYTYDAADRPTKTEVLPAGSSTASLTYTYTHNENDQLTGWSDATRSASYVYDDLGRKTSETLNYGNNVSLSYQYTYTSAGYVQSLTYPDGTQVSYSFDVHGAFSGMSIPGQGSISVNDWKWVAPTKLTFPGGTTREMSHDGLLKMTGLKVKNPGQQTIFEIANQFGKLEEIKQKAVTDASAGSGNSSTVVRQYAYDDERRLTRAVRDTGGLLGETVETFGFDAAGNRTSHSAVNGALTYDANNRLIQRGSGGNATTYQYDASGNLIEKAVGTSGSAASIIRYQYDPLNRLVALRDGANNLIAEYAYDPFDLRIVKVLHRDAAGQTLSTPRRTHYLYSDEGLIAEADAQGQITTQYGWKPDGSWSTDPVFIKTSIQDAQGNPGPMAYAYFHNDHLGTPLRATNPAGEIVWSAEHSSLGAATLPSNNRLTNNLRFAGQYFDAETALHYNTRRYYDPVAGRYITADPIGIAGGWNLYDYAGGDPANQMDPTGEIVPAVLVIWRAVTFYQTVTEMVEQWNSNGCVSWTSLIPIPRVIPRTKWIPKRIKQCTEPCSCALGGNSFTPETLVHTQDEQGRATLKPIASLKLGDKVLAKSEWKAEAESLSYEPITDIMVTPAQPRRLVDLVLANGQTLTATDGHPFKTTDGWRDAILLKKGGQLLLKGEGDSEQTLEISSVTHRTETQTTYNLEVANAHTFFVGVDGVLVHNGDGHHPFPKYLGGAEDQDLVDLTPEKHREYHRGLDKLAGRWKSKKYYDNLTSLEKDLVWEDFKEFTEKFDKENQTDLLKCARNNGFPK
jgi:RHS repeat-associated protein